MTARGIAEAVCYSLIREKEEKDLSPHTANRRASALSLQAESQGPRLSWVQGTAQVSLPEGGKFSELVWVLRRPTLKESGSLQLTVIAVTVPGGCVGPWVQSGRWYLVSQGRRGRRSCRRELTYDKGGYALLLL